MGLLLVLSNRMLHCFLDSSMYSWCHSRRDYLVAYSSISSKQRYHCSTAWFRYASSSRFIWLIVSLAFIGVFILIYTVNIRDARQSMIIDRINLANKVDRSPFNIIFNILHFCFIVVDAKIQFAKNHCSQYAVHFIDNDRYKATTTITVRATNKK